VKTRIGVLGGGVQALACADYLARDGYVPMLLESGDDGTQCRILSSVELEAFPQTITALDTSLCGWLGDLGLLGEMVWRRARTRIVTGGARLPLTYGRDIWSSSSVPLRMRGLLALGLLRDVEGKPSGLRLDDQTADEWSRAVFGTGVHRTLLRPLLECRFGARASEVSALWLWAWLRRALCDVRGHLPGGIGRIRERVIRRVLACGGELWPGVSAHGIRLDPAGISLVTETAEVRLDGLVTTWSEEQLAKVACPSLLARLPGEAPLRQGRVTTLVVARGAPASEASLEFIAPDGASYEIVDTSHVLPAGGRSGWRLLHVTRWCEAHGEAYLRDDARWRSAALEILDRCLDLRSGDVEAVWVSRQPDSLAICPPGSARRVARPEVPGAPLFLSGSAQAHPGAPTWESAVMAARRTARSVTQHLAANRDRNAPRVLKSR